MALESSGGRVQAPDAIAMVGLDSKIRAKARFKPRAIPWVLPNLSALLPEAAHVAAGRAYYVDGGGTVRSLGVDGDIREETRFPVTSTQQEVSFAVSPDGHDLMGAVVTLPPEPSPPPSPGYVPSAPYSMDVLTATSGSAARVAYHRTWTYKEHLGSGAQFIGWDQGGPLATWPSGLGTQGGGPHQWNGNVVHFRKTGPGSPLPAPAGCYPMDLLPTGVFVCGPGDNTFQVVGPDGGVRWRYAARDAGVSLTYCFLSPDARRVVSFGLTESTVYPQSGSPITMASGFYHGGWIDSQTVAGTLDPPGHLAYVSLARPHHAVELGLTGQIVGPLTI